MTPDFHEKLVQQYISALDAGDLTSIQRILRQAESDPILGAMLLEINEAYAEEHSLGELAQTTTAPQPKPILTLPQRKSGTLPSGISLIAAAMLVALAFLTLILSRTGSDIRSATSPLTQRPIISPANAQQIQTLNTLGQGAIYDLAWSPEGTTLAIASATGVYLYDASSGAASSDSQPASIGTSNSVARLAYNPNGEQLAALTTEGILVYDRQGTQIRRIEGNYARFLAFSPDGELLAGQCANATCTQLNLVSIDATGQTRILAEKLPLTPVIDAHGARIALIDADQVIIRDLDQTIEPDEIRLERVQRGAVLDAAFSPDGGHFSLLVDIGLQTNPRSSAGTQLPAAALITWDIDRGELISQGTVFNPYTARFLLTSEAEARYLDLSASPRGSARLSLRNPQPDVPVIASQQPSALKLRTLALNSQQNLLATAIDGRGLLIWSLDAQQTQAELLAQVAGFASQADFVAFSPLAQRVAVATDSELELWDYASGSPLFSAPIDQSGLGFLPTGEISFADGSQARASIGFWSPESGLRHENTGMLEVAAATAITHDSLGRLVTYFADSHSLARRDAESATYEIIPVDLPFAEDVSGAVALSDDGLLLAQSGCLDTRAGAGSLFACEDQIIALLSTSDGQRIAQITSDFSGGIQQLSFGHNPDDGSLYLAASGCITLAGTSLNEGCEAAATLVWEISAILRGESQSAAQTLMLDAAGSLDFSPDARLLALLGGDQLRLFRLSDGRPLLNLHIPGSDPALSFSPDGSLIGVGQQGTLTLLGIASE